MATELFERTMSYDHGDHRHNELMRKVWEPTPWMVDAYTGSIENRGRYRDMADWCFDEFGPECYPIHGKFGAWQRGGATVHGWTWFGFSTKEAMDKFVARWLDTTYTDGQQVNR